MFPTFMAKTTGFLFMVTAVIFLLGGFAQINPIWQFGQYEPYQISYAVQPDWYMGWLDGALRIMPSWEWVGWGHTIPLEVFLPAVIFPGIIFNIFIVWPFIESRHTKDLAYHNILDRPRDRPKRTGAGAAMLTLAGDDLLRVVHRRDGQLLRATAQGRPVVLPYRGGGVADHRLRGDLQDLPRDAGRRGHRQAQAGPWSSRGPTTGEYSTIESAPRPGDGTEELDAIPVPTFIDLVPPELATGEGVRRVMR